MPSQSGKSPATYARSLILRGDVAESIDVEAVETPGASDAAAIEALMPARVPEGYRSEDVRAVVEKVVRGNEPLTAFEDHIAEAIIIPDKRPAIDVINGEFAIDHPLWLDYAAGALHDAFVAAMPSIGRIELPGHPSLPYGGTGFVVGPKLVMTNRHVAQIFAAGQGQRNLRFLEGLSAGIDFLRERGSAPGVPLEVRRVVMIHPYWDMALLEVEGLAGHPALFLSTLVPDAAAPRRIGVVGYPAFDSRNDAGVQNEVFRGVYNIKRFQPGLFNGLREVRSFEKLVPAGTHDSSTLGGNSGSAVVDAHTGHVIGLHFAGVYLDTNYAVPAAELARDGRVIDAGVKIDGGGRRASGAWDLWWAGADADEQPTDGAGAGDGGNPPATAAPAAPVSSWIVPLRIDISVGTPTLAGAAAPGAAAIAPAAEERMVEPRHDGEHVPRAGYRADFIGLPVPVPAPRRPNELATLETGEHLVPYHHFSLAMHKRRRLALFTAANIDASRAAKEPEAGRKYTRAALGGLAEGDREKWFGDPRLRGIEQLPDKFFNKDNGAFDKGHLVRREDVAWGASYAEVQAANGDTFFTTNCSPQVADFNRSNRRDNWGALEDLVLKQAKTERYCLFSGPVLRESDRHFAGFDDTGAVSIQIPEAYWKVVVANDAGTPKVFAFVLKQELAAVPLEFTVPEQWKRFQIGLKALEDELDSLDFAPALHAADQGGE